MTPDPKGSSDGPNLYAYVHNDPLFSFDEYGLYDFQEWWEDTWDSCKWMASKCTHDVWNQAGPFVEELGRTFSYQPEAYQYDFTSRGHDSIDRFFGTDFAPSLLKSTFDSLCPESIAYLPFGPGSSGKAVFSATKEFIDTSNTILKVKNIAVKRFDISIKRNVLPKDHMWQNASPFKNKTAEELHQMFLEKGFLDIGKNPQSGLGSYLHPVNKRQYRIDPKNTGRYAEPSHVDISRPKQYKGPLTKKRFIYKDG